MKFFLPVVSTLLASANAEPEAKSWLGYSGLGYGGYGYGYATPLRSYGGYGIWKRDAEAKPEALYGNYGYSGLAGYGGAYTTGYTAAVPVYGYTGYSTGYSGYGGYGAGIWKRDAEAEPEALYGNYGYSGLAGYGGAYTTGYTVAAPVYGYTGYSGYGGGYGAGIWKRDADAEPEAEPEALYGNYGYSGLAGYGGAYTTGYAVAAPVYGYTGYSTGYSGYGGYGAGIWKREAESDPQAWYGYSGNYGYSGLGYGGAYTTASIARPVYGYSNLGYGSGYGLW